MTATLIAAAPLTPAAAPDTAAVPSVIQDGSGEPYVHASWLHRAWDEVTALRAAAGAEVQSFEGWIKAELAKV